MLEELGIDPEEQRRLEWVIEKFDNYMTEIVGGGYVLEDAFVDTGQYRTVFKISAIPTAHLKNGSTVNKALQN